MRERASVIAPMPYGRNTSGQPPFAVRVEGTLEKVMFANPHVMLTIRAKDSAVYTALWWPRSRLRIGHEGE